LFRANEFVIEDLIEPRPGPNIISSSGGYAGREPAQDSSGANAGPEVNVSASRHLDREPDTASRRNTNNSSHIVNVARCRTL
jgi:hypothetical protein